MSIKFILCTVFIALFTLPLLLFVSIVCPEWLHAVISNSAPCNITSIASLGVWVRIKQIQKPTVFWHSPDTVHIVCVWKMNKDADYSAVPLQKCHMLLHSSDNTNPQCMKLEHVLFSCLHYFIHPVNLRFIMTTHSLTFCKTTKSEFFLFFFHLASIYLTFGDKEYLISILQKIDSSTVTFLWLKD